MRRFATTAVVIALLSLSDLVSAEPDHGVLEQQHARLREAERLMLGGRFAEAGAAYQSAFKFHWDANILECAANAYRRAGRLDKAFLILSLRARLFVSETSEHRGDALLATIAEQLGPAPDDLRQMLPADAAVRDADQ